MLHYVQHAQQDKAIWMLTHAHHALKLVVHALSFKMMLPNYTRLNVPHAQTPQNHLMLLPYYVPVLMAQQEFHNNAAPALILAQNVPTQPTLSRAKHVKLPQHNLLRLEYVLYQAAQMDNTITVLLVSAVRSDVPNAKDQYKNVIYVLFNN